MDLKQRPDQQLSLGDEEVQALQRLQQTASVDLGLQNIIKIYDYLSKEEKRNHFYHLDTSLHI